ncbi:MAG TPA: methyl-accepting chemotaxis protein [Burkholderiaceae bacterium]
MASRSPLSIRARLNLSLVVTVTILLGVFGVLSHLRTSYEQQQRQERQIQAALSRLATSLPDAVWEYNQGQIDRILNSEMFDASVVGILAVAPQKLLGGLGRGGDMKPVAIKEAPKADASYSTELSYVDGGKKNAVGTVTIYVSNAEIAQSLHRDVLYQAGEVVLLDILLVLALSRILGGVVLKPLRSIGAALTEIGSGEADLTKRLPSASSKEFLGVSEGFNRFVDRLNEVVLEVRGHSDSVVTGAEEIANGNLDLSNRTERQASDLQQTVQAVKMLAAGVASNAGSASEANRLALEARKVAEEGGAMVNVVVNTMHSINENSKQVADIIGIINGIAFQTNILALNAAVEAARAGEQGRGFGVVAGEVRTLAQRSAQAAKEIKSLISRSTDEINVGYKEASAAGRMMGEIVGSVQRVSAVVQEIAASTALQSSGIEQIDDAITSIDQATQQNAALVEQSSAAATLLRDSAAGLMGAVSSFRVEGEPDRRGAGPSARPEAGSHP